MRMQRTAVSTNSSNATNLGSRLHRETRSPAVVENDYWWKERGRAKPRNRRDLARPDRLWTALSGLSEHSAGGEVRVVANGTYYSGGGWRESDAAPSRGDNTSCPATSRGSVAGSLRAPYGRVSTIKAGMVWRGPGSCLTVSGGRPAGRGFAPGSRRSASIFRLLPISRAYTAGERCPDRDHYMQSDRCRVRT
jgi:hypothetical protein